MYSSRKTSKRRKSNVAAALRTCAPSLTGCVRRLIEQGGDWDRRNRLKVYRGLHLLSIRQFAKGGELLLDRCGICIQTIWQADDMQPA
jgi:hypothetical protein